MWGKDYGTRTAVDLFVRFENCQRRRVHLRPYLNRWRIVRDDYSTMYAIPWTEECTKVRLVPGTRPPVELAATTDAKVDAKKRERRIMCRAANGVWGESRRPESWRQWRPTPATGCPGRPGGSPGRRRCWATAALQSARSPGCFAAARQPDFPVTRCLDPVVDSNLSQLQLQLTNANSNYIHYSAKCKHVLVYIHDYHWSLYDRNKRNLQSVPTFLWTRCL